jgi:hypothetical protein
LVGRKSNERQWTSDGCRTNVNGCWINVNQKSNGHNIKRKLYNIAFLWTNYLYLGTLLHHHQASKSSSSLLFKNGNLNALKVRKQHQQQKKAKKNLPLSTLTNKKQFF